MNARSTIVLLIAAVLLPAAARSQSAKPGVAAATALPEGTEPYGPAVLVAKEDSVPVRTDAGFVYREIKFLRKGQEVVIDGRKGPWFHVKPQGWILAEHLVTTEQLDQPAPAVAQVFVPIREGIRVRSSPSTDAAILRTLSAGEEVEAQGQEAGWWKLSSGGYVAAQLLRLADGEDQPVEAARAPSGPQPWAVSADSANVRSERNTTSSIVRKLTRGEVVPVTSVKDGWAEVNGGWVRADLLQAPAPAPAPRGVEADERRPAGGLSRSDRSDSGMRRWSLVDLNGVIFEVTDISHSSLLPQIKKELQSTGVLEDDWTYLGLTIGVPEDSTYRFNYSPERNTTIIVDADGQRFGNVYARGPFERLPAHVRQFFTEMTVQQGEKFDGLLLFKPSLKPENIREISIFIGGRMQRLYEDTSPAVK